MQAPDIRIDLNSGEFALADSQELVAHLRAETGLRVESDLFDYYSEGAPYPPDVILSILYTLLPLGDIYAGVLSSMLWDAAKAAYSRRGWGGSKANFIVRKVDEDGRIVKQVSGRTSDPEIIKDLIGQVSEEDEG